jgi:hypothetical protein
VFFIRHGEKPEGTGDDTPGVASGGSLGVQEDGRRNDHSLTPRGWQRAGALAALFAPAEGPLRPGIGTPTMLVAPDYGSPAEAAVHRPVQTLVPLAGRLGLQLSAPCARGGEAELVTRHVLEAHDAVVLVCWDHEHIPALVDTLTGVVEVTPEVRLPPTGWPDSRYDTILAFTRLPGDRLRYEFAEVLQLVLPGDHHDLLTQHTSAH